MHKGEALFAAAQRETLLTAGAIGSPQILQCSGIGPAALLQRHGIAVAHDLPGVGANLHDHLQLRMAFRVSNVKTLNTMAHSLWGKLMMGLEYAVNRSGPLSMAPSQLGAFVKSDDTQATPDLEYHVQPLSLDKFGDPLHTFPGFTASVCNLRPTSRGSVQIKAPDSAVAPAIAPPEAPVRSRRSRPSSAVSISGSAPRGNSTSITGPAMPTTLPSLRSVSVMVMTGALSQCPETGVDAASARGDTSTRRTFFESPAKASAPPTISMISVVMLS